MPNNVKNSCTHGGEKRVSRAEKFVWDFDRDPQERSGQSCTQMKALKLSCQRVVGLHMTRSVINTKPTLATQLNLS